MGSGLMRRAVILLLCRAQESRVNMISKTGANLDVMCSGRVQEGYLFWDVI